MVVTTAGTRMGLKTTKILDLAKVGPLLRQARRPPSPLESKALGIQGESPCVWPARG
jgi:hypothetical protein